MTLADLPLGQKARLGTIDWTVLAPEEAKRLQALGFDSGAEVSVDYRGMFGGKDPLAVTLGDITIALRRLHAAAMQVEPLA